MTFLWSSKIPAGAVGLYPYAAVTFTLAVEGAPGAGISLHMIVDTRPVGFTDGAILLWLNSSMRNQANKPPPHRRTKPRKPPTPKQ